MRLREFHYRRPLMYAVTTACAGVAATVLLVASYAFVALPYPAPTHGDARRDQVLHLPRLAESATGGGPSSTTTSPTCSPTSAGNVGPGAPTSRARWSLRPITARGLTEQLKIDKVQLSWSLTFEQVMRGQEKRVDSQLAKRIPASLSQASVSGGKIQDVLDSIQRHTSELHQIDKETKNALRPYIATIYIAVGIFLAISVVLLDTFFAKIFASSAKVGQGASIFAGLGGLSLPALKQAFLQMGLMESVFGGLGRGRRARPRSAAGFKHVIVLAVMNIVVFTIFVS